MKTAFLCLGGFALLLFVSLLALVRARSCDPLGDLLWRWRALATGGVIVGISGWGCSLGVVLALLVAQ